MNQENLIVKLRKEILTLVSKHISEDQIKMSIIYLNKEILKAKTQIRIGNVYKTMPFDGYRIFIDLEPKANWSHSALYLLTDIQMQQTEVFKSNSPPWEELPMEEVVLFRYGKPPIHERYIDAYNDSDG
jgi:hypothetical protein